MDVKYNHGAIYFNNTVSVFRKNVSNQIIFIVIAIITHPVKN
jgi:hypothetical protein